MSEQAQVPSVFTLTTITGRRKSEDREKVVGTVEMNQRFVNTVLLGLIPTAAIAGLAATLIGVWSVMVGGVVMVAWLLLVYRRSRDGLQLRTMEVMMDRRRTLAGKFVQCGQVITPEHYQPYQIVTATAPIHRPPEADAVAALDGAPAAPERPAVDAATARKALRHSRKQHADKATAAPLTDLIA